MINLEKYIKNWKKGNVKNDIYHGVDNDNNNVVLDITNEILKISTFQKNNWIRINIYHKDGFIEELYERGE